MADEEAGPWTRYQQKTPSPVTTPPAEGGPWQKYGQQPAPAEEPGMLSRLWSGMTGQDVSRAGRVGMGVADPAYGMAQLGAHGNFGLPMPASAAPMQGKLAAATDKAVAEREAGYQQREKAAGLSGGLSSEWARLAGQAASPVNLALGGAAGAAARGAPIAARLGSYAAGGAASGVAEPATEPGVFEPGAMAKRAAVGGLGGAAGGAVGEAIGSGLGRAIAGNSPQAVESYVNRAYRNVVKPGRAGTTSAPQLDVQDWRILTAVDQVIANQPNLRLTDPGGNVMQGQLPRSLRQFSEALDQTKGSIFRQYDQMAKDAGTQGLKVDLAPTAQKLYAIAGAPQVVDLHPEVGKYAADLANRMLARRFYSPAKAQDIIEALNTELQGFYRNPQPGSASRTAALAPAARELRESLDSAIANSPIGPGYQQLRHQYGALRSVEKDVAASVQREANKLPGGIGGTLMDFASGEELLRGVIHLNPTAVATGVGLKAAKAWMKHINDPSAAITRIFSSRAAPPSGPMRSAIGEGAQAVMPAVGVDTGASAAEDRMRTLRHSIGGP